MDQTAFILIQFFSVASNLTVLVIGVKLIRHISRMEFKVDLMWSGFCKQYDLSPTGHERRKG